jgi:hypothetical protein
MEILRRRMTYHRDTEDKESKENELRHLLITQESRERLMIGSIYCTSPQQIVFSSSVLSVSLW